MHDADRHLLDHFAGVRSRTIELVERLPSELLDRTPDGEEMSLRWHLVHIADGPDWWLTNVLRDGGAWGWPPPYAEQPGGLVRGLTASRDRVLRFFGADDGKCLGEVFTRVEDGKTHEWVGRDRVLYLTDHEIHHRGRIVLALMQWGFEDFPGEPGLWPATAG